MEDLLSQFKLPITERDLTAAEREYLIAWRDGADVPTLRQCMSWSAVWITLGGIAVVVLRLTGFEVTAFLCPGLSLALFLLLTWAGFFDHHSRRAGDRRKQVGSALEYGKARVVRIESHRAILIEEVADLGPDILLDIGEARTLVLRGQEWYESLNGGSWPSTVIEVVETADPVVYLGPYSYGDRLDTILRLDPYDPKHTTVIAWIMDSLKDSHYTMLHDQPFEAIWQKVESMLD